MDYFDLLPLKRETADTVRARMDGYATLGFEEDDAGVIDLTQGGAYWDLTQGSVLEAEALWDFLGGEVVAAMFVQSTWGSYLDLHGEQLGVERKDEAKAQGSVTVTGVPGATVQTGMQFAQPATDEDSDPVTFVATQTVVLTGATASVPIEAFEAGLEGTVAANQISQILTETDGITDVTNPAATSGGADVESDESYQGRLLAEWRSPGAAGNVSDYEKWARAWPGVGYVAVTPSWGSPLGVHVVIADSDRNPVSPSVEAALQDFLDPGDGSKRGEAPVGANVTVDTVTKANVTVSVNIGAATGYSTTGANGTINVSPTVKAALIDYINSLGPGDDVILSRLYTVIYQVAGVSDAGGLQLNSGTSNVAIADTQVAYTDTSKITVGAL